MAFCSHCGSQLPEGAPTCPTCGAPVGSGNAQQNFQQSTQNPTDKGVTFGNAKNLTEDFDPNDLASSNKWAYILAYLWILFFLPLVVCPDSKVGKFHANQGLVMLIFSFAVGIISDLVGKREVDEWLDRDGLRPYFRTVQQSSICYVRKPGPAIFYYAMEEVGIPAENSAFLGDNLDRDIVGAKAVNMGMTIAAKWGAKKYKLNEENRPDCVIFRFPQLLDLFPEAGRVNEAAMIPPEEAWKEENK